MNLKIYPKKLSGKVGSISSKSDAHRVLICSAFCEKETAIKIGQISKDIETTISCLEKMGAKIIKIGFDTFKVIPIKFVNQSIKINVKESGATLRFLLPIVAALGVNAEVKCEGRLSERPLQEFLSVLENHGAKYSTKKPPLQTSGQIRGGKFVLSGNISSQFISGILLASPFMNEDIEIELNTKCESVGYINMTIDTMKKFGVKVIKNDSGYFVAKSQKYVSPLEIRVEGDWSNSAFWLAAGAICGSVQVNNLNLNSCQPDKQIIDILKKIGSNIEINGNNFKAQKCQLKSIQIDVSNIPDLVPILAVLASVSKGKTKFFNAKRLRFKESNRLQSIAKMLENLGVDVTENGNSLEIIGKKNLNGGTIESFGDHRIVMAAAVAACVCDNVVIIKDFEAVSKSYPKFFEDYKILGGDFSVI